jgi:hypothetical protein
MIVSLNLGFVNSGAPDLLYREVFHDQDIP